MHIWVVKKKTLYIALAVLVCIILILVAIFSSGILKTFLSDNSGGLKSEDKRIAMIFSDDIGASNIQIVMQVLKRYDAKGTFYLSQDWVNSNADIAELILSGGGEIDMRQNAQQINTNRESKNSIAMHFHNNSQNVEGALVDVLQSFKEQGFKFVTVSNL